jgi:hypothetical protein
LEKDSQRVSSKCKALEEPQKSDTVPLVVASLRKENFFRQIGGIESSEKPKAATIEHHTRSKAAVLANTEQCPTPGRCNSSDWIV